jgi:methanethiol S-methyltransferase
MIAWINFATLIFASLLFLYYYTLSVSPATREKILGSEAYAICARDRIISGVFEGITVINYLVYIFYHLQTPLPEKFPWTWWISVILAVLVGTFSGMLMFIGMRDAGEETLRPKKEHSMYGGIYTKIRHPQAVGEVFAWLAIAFLLNSPFLALFSLIYFPIFIMLCLAEEQDLLWRYGEAYAEYCKQTGAFWPKKAVLK